MPIASNNQFIAISSASSVGRLTDTVFVQAKIPIAPRFEVEQIILTVAVAEAGLGVTAFRPSRLRYLNGAI
jgi:hypothetical protein